MGQTLNPHLIHVAGQCVNTRVTPRMGFLSERAAWTPIQKCSYTHTYHNVEVNGLVWKNDPHQGVGNVPLPEAGDEPLILQFPSGKVKCRERLGGVLRHYDRAAA